MLLKKCLTIIISFILVLGLCACGQEEEPATTAVVETSSEEQTTAASPEPVTDDNSVTIATGTITGQLSTPYATEEGDTLIASLIMPTLYTYDRSGDLLTFAASGKTIAYQGIDYNYKGLANITSSYDSATDITTYNITLGIGAKFSDGSSITADDLIFTYYFLCDESYTGSYSLSDEPIIGIKAYQLNNSMAPSIEITDEDISAALDSPTEELKALINEEIIRPILQEGRVFCEENWERYVERGYGDSDQELFVMLFPQAIESEYSGEDKTFDEIFEDTVALYGMNYKAIARIYYGEIDYLDDSVNSLVERYIYETRLATAGGVEVPSISGINRVSDDSVSVSVVGKSDEVKDKICNIPILSLNHYGDKENYDYAGNNFGITRGDVSAVKSHSGSPLGYGPYKFETIENGVVSLVPNEYYTLGNVPTAEIKFVNIVKADRIANLEAGNIDFAELELSAEEIELLSEANGGQISGDVISAVINNAESYEYFGLNATTLNFGEGDGLYVRQALATLITAYKSAAIEKNLGAAGKEIYYPGSSSSWAVPQEGSADYEESFKLADGADLLTEIRNIFVTAGYSFEEDGTVKEDKNLKTNFTLAIPSYIIDDHVMMEIYENIESALDQLGFTISPTYFDQTDEFILALQAKTYDLWLAERSTENLNPEKYYDSEGNYNYYGLVSSAIDELFDQVSSESVSREDAYPRIYNLVMDSIVEVPVYQKQTAIIYNASKVIVENNNFTEFFTIFNDMSSISNVLTEN